MRTFKDKNGKDWAIEVDLETVTRVRAETGIQIIDLVLGNGGEKLANDYEAVGQFLWSVNAPEAKRRGVTPEDFPRLFDGTAIDACMRAIAEAVADFLSPSRRELATKILSKGDEVTRHALATAIARVDAVNAEQLVMKLSDGSTNSAASPASTPVA